MNRPITDIKSMLRAYDYRVRHVCTDYIDCKDLGIVTIVEEKTFSGDVLIDTEMYCKGNDKAIAFLNGEIV